jgi:hypothetical protein
MSNQIQNIVDILNRETIVPIALDYNDNNLDTPAISNFYSTDRLKQILPFIKNQIAQVNVKGKGGVGSVYNFGNYMLKVSNICQPEQNNILLDQLCGMTKDNISYIIPNTETGKNTLLCPNYIVEPIIGGLLKRVENSTPSFMKIFGCIYDTDEKKTYQILEPLVKLKDAGNNLDINYIFFQLFYALNSAQKGLRYTHWDLHYENIMVRKREPTIQKYDLNDGTFLYSKLPYDLVIIDYGHNRCETEKTCVVPIMKFVPPGSQREILDYYDFNPFYDIFTIIYSTYLNMYKEKQLSTIEYQGSYQNIMNYCDLLLGIFLKDQYNFQDKVNNMLYSAGSWRVFPERLTIEDTPLNASEMINVISKRFEYKVDIKSFAELDMLLDKHKGIIVSDSDLKINNEYVLPDNVLPTEYYPYFQMPINLGRLGVTPYEISMTFMDDIRIFKKHNFTRNTFGYMKQHVTSIKMMQPSLVTQIQDGVKVFSFRSDCCRIDTRSFFQNDKIKEGFAMNASFFNIFGDFTPIGPYKNKNLFINNNPIPQLYYDLYRAIVIDYNGDINIIGIQEAIDEKEQYTDILCCGPILIENNDIVMTNELLETSIKINDDVIFPFLCNRPKTREEINLNVLPRNYNVLPPIYNHRVMNCNKIKPGELSHAGNVNPRSAVGIDKENHVYFFCVSGREDYNATGLDLADLASYLKVVYDLRIAVNLDGGRSSNITCKIDNQIFLSNINNVGGYPVGNILSYVRE